MRFEVKAFRSKGQPVSITLDAVDAADAGKQAERQGYAVLKVRARNSISNLWSARGAQFPLALFSQQLRSLIEAGLSLIEALEALAEKETHPETGRTIAQLIGYLREGRSLSFGMQELSGAFPSLYVATIRASERTGDLGAALERCIAYQAQVDAMRKKIVGASIYPVLLLAVGGVVVLFLMGYVVPKFSAVYENATAKLPWLSALLIDWGRLLQAHGLVIMIALLAGASALLYGLSRPELRQNMAALLWRIPALGERMRIYQLTRLYRALAMLLDGGIPVTSALDMVPGLLQPALRERLLSAGRMIREGQPISHAMELSDLATPVALRLLRVGERSGQMGEMMGRIAAFYEDETARWVEWFMRLFEPLLMVLIGTAIGIILVLMYLPIFEIAGSMQ